MAQVCQKSEKIEKYPREKSYNGFCNRGKTIFSLALGIIKSVCKRFGVILSSGLKIPDFWRKSSLFQISEKNQISALKKNIFLAMKTFCLGTSAVQPLYLEASREPTICVSRLFFPASAASSQFWSRKFIYFRKIVLKTCFFWLKFHSRQIPMQSGCMSLQSSFL